MKISAGNRYFAENGNVRKAKVPAKLETSTNNRHFFMF